MKVTKLAAWAIVLFLAVLGFSLSMPYWYYPDAQVYHLNMNDPEVLAQGEYAAIAGDCVACHTAPGGQKFSGGLAMETPVGVLRSEERRVGKECRARWSRDHGEEKRGSVVRRCEVGGMRV